MNRNERYIYRVSREEVTLLKKRRRRKKKLRSFKESLRRRVLICLWHIYVYFIPWKFRTVSILGIIYSFCMFQAEGKVSSPDPEFRGCMLVSMVVFALPLLLSTKFLKEEIK